MSRQEAGYREQRYSESHLLYIRTSIMSDSMRLNHRHGTQLTQTKIKEGWDRATSDSLIEGFQLSIPKHGTT